MTLSEMTESKLLYELSQVLIKVEDLQEELGLYSSEAVKFRKELESRWGVKPANTAPKRRYSRRRTCKAAAPNHGKAWDESDRSRAQLIGHRRSDIKALAKELGRTMYSVEWQRNLYESELGLPSS